MGFGISLELKEAKPFVVLWVASIGISIDPKSKLKSIGTSKVLTREPDSASHEQHTFFFPDTRRGTANTAGFGWRGGSGV
jgi:hypothetical protein